MFQSFCENFSDKVRIKSFLWREILAEFIATFFLLVIFFFSANIILFFQLIGISANIQEKISTNNNNISINFAWGFGFTFAIYLAINVSGKILNEKSLKINFKAHI